MLSLIHISLMIDYQKLQDEKVLADKNAELAAAQYNATVRKQQLSLIHI